MAKKKKVKTLKNKLDGIFSVYIRMRDAQRRDAQSKLCPGQYAVCCSGGGVFHWKDMDAGHWISRGQNATRYDERNVHAQSRKLNRFGGGEAGYALFMLRNYGQEVMDELDRLSRTTKHFRPPELQEMIDKYKQKIKELEGN